MSKTVERVERGMVVRYHGSIEDEHVFAFIVTGPETHGDYAEGRYKLSCRDYPEHVLRQVRPASFTPTGEKVELCRCGHEFSWRGHRRGDEPDRCGVYSCECRVHVSDSVHQLVDAGNADAASPEWTEGDPCEVCGEGESADDPIAHFAREDGQAYVMAHGQCGVDAELRLA